MLTPCLLTRLYTAICCGKAPMEDVKMDEAGAVASPVHTALHRSATMARGGFCKVYMCVDAAGRRAACKVLINADLGARELARERALLDRLRHPHIVQLMPTQPGGPEELYLEWGGRDLLEVPLETRRKREAQWVPQLFSAVMYLHLALVAHMDLKLENIVVDDGGKLRLVDFGLAVALTHAAQMYQARCGSRAYAAPEVLADAAYDPRAADAWSLGVTLYVYATDVALFATADHHDPHYSRFFVASPHSGVSRVFGFDAGDALRAAVDILVRVQPGLRATVGKAAYEYHAVQKRACAGMRGRA